MADQHLLKQLKESELPTPALLASIFASDTPVFRLIGLLLRETEERQLALLSADLVSEEGRLKALRRQGEIAGAMDLLDRMLELLTEGKSHEQAPE